MPTATTTSRAVNTLPCAGDPEQWYDPNHTAEAKTQCGDCTIREACLTLALTAEEPWGVWGGYTPIERERLTAGHTSRPCHSCHVDCVTADPERNLCDGCADRQQNRRVDDDVEQIRRLTDAGHTVREIAERLGWRDTDIKQCRARHGILSPHPDGGGFRWRPASLMPCGTPSAYRRHQRRNEPIDEPCRLAYANSIRQHKLRRAKESAQST